MTDCVFCSIVSGKGPASVVYQDETVMAIMSIGPINPGHTLVIPTKHAGRLAALDEADGLHMFRIAMRLDQAIRASRVRCEGVNLHLADGETAGQDVFHVPLHVIPRFAGDSFKLEIDYPRKPQRQVYDTPQMTS